VLLIRGVTDEQHTLSATHAKPGERIFENLLETEEFEDREIDCGMEAKAAFVRAECRVVLQNRK